MDDGQRGNAGLGRWGRLPVGSVQGRSAWIRFGAGVARSPDTAREFCDRHGIFLQGDYKGVPNDANVDAAVLATPRSLHSEQVMAAAGAGKHEFRSKPFTLTRRDAETAPAALEAAALKVAAGHGRRFAPTHWTLNA